MTQTAPKEVFIVRETPPREVPQDLEALIRDSMLYQAPSTMPQMIYEIRNKEGFDIQKNTYKLKVSNYKVAGESEQTLWIILEAYGMSYAVSSYDDQPGICLTSIQSNLHKLLMLRALKEAGYEHITGIKEHNIRSVHGADIYIGAGGNVGFVSFVRNKNIAADGFIGLPNVRLPDGVADIDQPAPASLDNADYPTVTGSTYHHPE